MNHRSETSTGGLSQGIALFSNGGVQRFRRRIVRNVEETDEAELPEAETKIADVEAKDATKFRSRRPDPKDVLSPGSEELRGSLSVLGEERPGRCSAARIPAAPGKLGGGRWTSSY